MITDEENEKFLSDITSIIDFWYLDWKTKMTANGEPHCLGVAKERLKYNVWKYLRPEEARKLEQEEGYSLDAQKEMEEFMIGR